MDATNLIVSEMIRPKRTRSRLRTPIQFLTSAEQALIDTQSASWNPFMWFGGGATFQKLANNATVIAQRPEKRQRIIESVINAAVKQRQKKSRPEDPSPVSSQRLVQESQEPLAVGNIPTSLVKCEEKEENKMAMPLKESVIERRTTAVILIELRGVENEDTTGCQRGDEVHTSPSSLRRSPRERQTAPIVALPTLESEDNSELQRGPFEIIKLSTTPDWSHEMFEVLQSDGSEYEEGRIRRSTRKRTKMASRMKQRARRRSVHDNSND